jgi:hypothetical protein
MRAITALARADLLERLRRYSFLITLAFVLWLGIGTFDGSVSVDVGGTQGVVNAAWVGGMMSLVAITFLSLAGFWVVKNAVERDERTGVGPILATTPLSRVEYTVGKALSHFLVLVTMVGLLALCGIALLVLQGGGAGAGARFDPFVFFAPFLFCVVPALALTAAIAILFETTPGLRGGAANALWFFGWGGLLVLSLSGARNPLFDPWGILVIQKSMAAAAQAQLGIDPSQFSIQLNPGQAGSKYPTFLWTGVQWTAPILLSRLAWLGFALGVAALAALPFHRFDPSRRAWRVAARKARQGPIATTAARSGRWSPWAMLPSGIVGSELRLLLGGANRWWSLVAVGLAVACWVAPLPAARSGVLLAAWIWPLLRWSDLGARDARNGTEAFVLTAPRALTRQLPAAWIAGVLLTAAMGAGVGVRLLLAGDGSGALGWAAGTLFIPAMALALGLVSRGTKLFEVLYTILWYIGPAHHTPELDFMGATAAGRPVTWLIATAALLAVAFVVRARQLRG